MAALPFCFIYPQSEGRESFGPRFVLPLCQMLGESKTARMKYGAHSRKQGCELFFLNRRMRAAQKYESENAEKTGSRSKHAEAFLIGLYAFWRAYAAARHRKDKTMCQHKENAYRDTYVEQAISAAIYIDGCFSR